MGRRGAKPKFTKVSAGESHVNPVNNQDLNHSIIVLNMGIIKSNQVLVLIEIFLNKPTIKPRKAK